MRLTLNHVAALALAGAVAVACTTLGTDAQGEQLAAGFGLAGGLVTIAGTVVGRDRGK